MATHITDINDSVTAVTSSSFSTTDSYRNYLENSTGHDDERSMPHFDSNWNHEEAPSTPMILKSGNIKNCMPAYDVKSIEELAIQIEKTFHRRRYLKSKSQTLTKMENQSDSAPKRSLTRWYPIVIPILILALFCECFLMILYIRSYTCSSELSASTTEPLSNTNSCVNSSVTSFVRDVNHEKDHDELDVVISDDILNNTIGTSYDAKMTLMINYDRVEEEREDMESRHKPAAVPNFTSTPYNSINEVEILKKTCEDEDNEFVLLQARIDEAFEHLLKAQSAPDTMEKNHSMALRTEALCEVVGSRAREVLSLSAEECLGTVFLRTNKISLNNGTLKDGGANQLTIMKIDDQIPKNRINMWKSLSLRSRLCIGGAKMLMLSKNVDKSKLQLARNIFERLSHVHYHNVDVQAGLGTLIMLEGLLKNGHQLSSEYDVDEERILLTQAVFHLKLASSLSQDGSSLLNNKALTSNAAILHKLSLAYLALGDNNSSLHVMLRVAELLREGNSKSLLSYMNLPNELIKVVEERALILGAKRKKLMVQSELLEAVQDKASLSREHKQKQSEKNHEAFKLSAAGNLLLMDKKL